MENFLLKPIKVSLDNLWPDPNNPRLALEDAPGYTDPKALFDQKRRAQIFLTLGEGAYDVSTLVHTIIGQGWMAIDNMIVWKHPKDSDHFIVVEGNRRRLALEEIRIKELPKEQKKLQKMKDKASTFAKKDLEEQKKLVAQLERIVAETATLTVVPLDASTLDELDRKLPRVLAVRHITGAREWGNYAEDLWLLKRFRQLFEDKHGKNKGFFWDDDVLKHVSAEASIGKPKAKRQLKAASWFSHFRLDWESELPKGEEFGSTDYYLFEQISKRPWIRQQFRIGEDDSAIPKESERALFEWVFRLPRDKKNADNNPNKFFRHENITLWDQIHQYDESQQGRTSFAMRFDVDKPEEAPRMREVEAQYLSHKAQRRPHAILDDLLQRLTQIPADTLASEGEAFRLQLEQLRTVAERFLKMIKAAAAK
jgi:hypothetical protein